MPHQLQHYWEPYPDVPTNPPIARIMTHFESLDAHRSPQVEHLFHTFHTAASVISENCPHTAELTVALRSLLVARDAAVRAATVNS